LGERKGTLLTLFEVKGALPNVEDRHVEDRHDEDRHDEDRR
jgi:hypothetical protein